MQRIFVFCLLVCASCATQKAEVRPAASPSPPAAAPTPTPAPTAVEVQPDTVLHVQPGETVNLYVDALGHLVQAPPTPTPAVCPPGATPLPGATSVAVALPAPTPAPVAQPVQATTESQHFRVMSSAGLRYVPAGGCMDVSWMFGLFGLLPMFSDVGLEFAGGTGTMTCNGTFQYLQFRAGPEFALLQGKRLRFAPGLHVRLSFPMDDPTYSDNVLSLRTSYQLYRWLEVGVDPEVGRAKAWDFPRERWSSGLTVGLSGWVQLRF